MSHFNYDEYARLLKEWIIFSQRHLYRCPDRPDLVCYGIGESDTWSVHTHQKAFSAFAIAATSPRIDFSDTNITKEQVREQALAMLRYTLSNHLTGDYVCTNGKQWGHSWIAILGFERMYHGIESLDPYLTENDKVMIKRLMVDECEFLLNKFPILATLVDVHSDKTKRNRPESNIWNGAILYRTALLYPDLENAEKYKEKAFSFFINGISIESDENSDEIIDGKRVGDYFIGANMFDSFACDHHGYLNFGYMTICLSNIAMLHFTLKSKGIKCPEVIYHNAYEQWKLIRSTTFDDGRLLRLGGDTRARYCYCQDYAFVSWSLIEDVFGEDCSALENGWLNILKKETSTNADGSFLSNRFGHFENLSPLYYTRLETDRANSISLVLYWHEQFDLTATKKSHKLDSWSEKYHCSAFSAKGNRFASFTFRSAEGPQGIIVPKDDSSLVEWRYNLSGRIHGVGSTNNNETERNNAEEFEGGFLSYGSLISFSDNFLAEGQPKQTMARKYIAFAALPDENTVLCLQYARSLYRVALSETAGILWNIPNDVFNGRSRHLIYENGDNFYRGGDYATTFETIPLGHYVNADGKIGLASINPLTLVRSGKRQVTIRGKEACGTLYAEEICSDYNKGFRWIEANKDIFNVGFALTLGGVEDTKQLNESLFTPEIEGLNAIGVTGKNGKKYLLIANFSEEACMFDPNDLADANYTDLTTNQKPEKKLLEPTESLLLEF